MDVPRLLCWASTHGSKAKIQRTSSGRSPTREVQDSILYSIGLGFGPMPASFVSALVRICFLALLLSLVPLFFQQKDSTHGNAGFAKQRGSKQRLRSKAFRSGIAFIYPSFSFILPKARQRQRQRSQAAKPVASRFASKDTFRAHLVCVCSARHRHRLDFRGCVFRPARKSEASTSRKQKDINIR